MDLPASSVNRIVKEVLPEGFSVARQTKQAMVKAASLFVQYITTIATDIAEENQGKKKVLKISSDDIALALEDMELNQLAEQLQPSLGKRTAGG